MLAKLKEIFSKVMKVDIDIESSNRTVPKWDSLNHLNLILELERSFKVSFNINDIPELISIRSIIAKLSEKGIKQ